MLARRIVCFVSLVALLASYFGIYLDAFTGGVIPSCVFHVLSLLYICLFSVFADYPRSSVHRSVSTPSIGIGLVLLDGVCASVCPLLFWVLNFDYHTSL